MSTENFDIKALQDRIEEVKKENAESTVFTRNFMECLIVRHDLPKIMHEDHEMEDIPKSIVDKLKKGEIPTEDEISEMDVDTQDTLIKECVWICGMGAIAWYSENDPSYEDEETKPFEEIIQMPKISVGHHSGSYLVAAFALLQACIPSQEMISAMTNNFDSSDEQIEKNGLYYSNLCFSILRRYQEDLEYLNA